MMKRTMITVLLALVAGLMAFADGSDTNEMKYRPLQVTFFFPAGSNGLNSPEFSNGFSLNILAGMNGGLRGAEFSGLAGLLKGDMKGAQFAGLLNTAGGDMKGFQAAGLVNVVGHSSHGMQAAGLVNVVGGKFKGAQVAGLVNVTAGKGKGFQAAGLVNVSAGAKVTQIAGLANVATKLKGVQIGLFNYADTVESGIPVGLFSIVGKGGYHAFEIAGNETFYFNPDFKLGVRHFYTVFTAGVSYRDEMIFWGWGLGAGTRFPIAKKADLSLEAICYQVNLDEWFTHGPNLLNRINLSFAWQVAPHLALTFTPSWNVTVEDQFNEYGEKVREPWAPWSVYDIDWGNGFISEMYPGVGIGIRF